MSAPPLHGHALRKGRASEPGRAYLLTTVTDRRRPVFGDWRIGRLLVAELRAEHEAGRVESLAWVVMPDHLHWLTILREETLDALMRRVKSRSAIAINSVLGDNRPLWQKGYHDHAVRAEEDLRVMARREALIYSVRGELVEP